MGQSENLSSFFKDSKPLFKEYIETRLELFRLQAIRVVSQSAGYLVWILISLFLLFLIMIFSGIVLGCWLSNLLNSYVLGFGLTTLILIVIFILLAVFRKKLFVHPVIQAIISKTSDSFDDTQD
ncbi:MAG: phage holin family protein [Bacteroidetes bacterium]|nr:phage holin family protein [Bacteroidota bacterium]